MKQQRLSKPWYTSKTIWFNIAVVVGSALSGAVVFLPMLQPILTPYVYAVAFFIIGVVNVVLRTITDKGIGDV